MPYATVHGYQIHYETFGIPKDIPVILVHGLTSSLKIWRDLPAKIGAQFYCIALDLLGFGESEKPTNATQRIDEEGEIVLGLMDVLEIDRVILVGHSMGGEIALWIASHHPERVAKVVPVAAVIEGNLSIQANVQFWAMWVVCRYFPPFVGHFLTRLLRVHSPLRWFVIERMYYARRPHPDEMLFEVFDEMFRRDNYPNKAASIAALYRYRALDDAALITVPILILPADTDRTIPLHQALSLKAKLPSAEFVTLTNCGHVITHDAPDQFLTALLDFLNR